MHRPIILIVVIVLALAGTGLVWFGSHLTSPSAIETPAAASEESSIRLSQLRNLRDIRLDTAILEDPFFRSLSTTQGVTVVQEGGQGRPNPFLPF